MVDRKFFDYAGPFTLTQIAEMSGARLENCDRPETEIQDVAPLDAAGARDIGFIENRRYLEALYNTRAKACFISEDLAERAPNGLSLLVTATPRQNFARISNAFYPVKPLVPGVHSMALVHPTAIIAEGCQIGAGAVIEAGVTLGESCMIEPNVYIGRSVAVGESTRIGAGASLSHCEVGARCLIYPGARIGQAGFGFETDVTRPVKMPQLGRVIIEADVEVGANTTIDRGSGPDTIIGQGTMIDNLVQIGHNVVVGKGCIIVAQVGVAGSTRIGDHTILAGQVGIAGHLTVGSRVTLAAKSGVTRDILDDQVMGGIPAVPIRDWRRQVAAVKALARSRSKGE